MLRTEKRGTVLVFILVITIVCLGLTTVSLLMVKMRVLAHETRREIFSARQIAESAACRAITEIREGGILEPASGSGSSPSWINFGTGDLFYETTYSSSDQTSIINAWGRIPFGSSQSSSQVAPDDISWDGEGWLVRGIEVAVMSKKFVPETPLYFGNGGIERPVGGFEWVSGTDINDSSTWSTVSEGSHSSYQASSIPFEVSALDHPVDYLYTGNPPAAPTTYPHPYSIWGAQNPIGQKNIDAWFNNSAGSGYNPLTKVTPEVTTHYDNLDPQSEGYQFPVDSSVPDVQTYAEQMWNRYKTDSDTMLLNSGSHSGTYGDLSNPGITFVTGDLTVNAGDTFKGAGILVVRDNYDPNDPNLTDNTPSTRAIAFFI